MGPAIEKKVELGKRYKFPQLSTRDVEVIETVENWIEFYENELVWYCEYKGLWKDDEDVDTKVTRDIERFHCWRTVVAKSDIAMIDYHHMDGESLWMVKVHVRESDNMNLAFSSREKAERMYKYFCQYKGYEHY